MKIMKDGKLVNVEDLGLKEPPYFDELKARIGHFPIVELTKTMSLPRRYKAGAETKFRMQRCLIGDRFEVVDIIPGKRSPQNIVIEKIGTSTKFVVEPKLFTMDALKVLVDKSTGFPLIPTDKGIVPATASTDRTSWPGIEDEDIIPKGPVSDLQKIIEQRKENAGWVI